MGSMRSEPRRNMVSMGYLVRAGLVCLIYFITARYGLGFDAVSGFATLVWPPTGIALVILVLYDFRMWPAIALGAFLVNWSEGAPLLGALGISLGNTLEAVTGAYLLKQIVGFDNTFRKLRNVIGFVFLAAIVSTLVSATIGVASLFVVGTVHANAVANTWIAWWIGDMLGALIVAPFLITVFDRKSYRRYLNIERLTEALVLGSLVILVAWLVFFNILRTGPEDATFAYLLFPLLVLVAVRFEVAGAALSTLIVSVISIWGTVLGKGPFIFVDLSTSLFLLQVFMASVSVTTLVLSSSLSERRLTTDELVDRRNKDEALLESIGEGVIATDMQGDIILYNNAAGAMLQVPSQEALGRRYDAILRLEDETGEIVTPLERPLKQALADGKIFMSNATTKPVLYYVRHDGTRFPIALTVAPIFMGKDVIGVINAFRDITYEWEIDQAKSEFISIASHQLRTPLSTMKWHSELLLSEEAGKLTAMQRQYIEDMHHSNERMIELLNALLSISQIEMGMYSPELSAVDIKDVADEVVRELTAPISSKNIYIVKDYSSSLAKVVTDRKFLRIVFQNLLSNSIKYSPRGSVIDLKLEEDDGGCRITVADHGCGIPASETKNVFKKFFRAANARSLETDGSGLGLYIVKSIIDHIGGSISFVSKPDVGTTFTVILPHQPVETARSESLI
jgi:PAS domain S-box-containing protein